jgi:hypothetical protein
VKINDSSSRIIRKSGGPTPSAEVGGVERLPPRRVGILSYFNHICGGWDKAYF